MALHFSLHFSVVHAVKMPKRKEKVKSVDQHDRGKSWGVEEEDLLVGFWARQEIKDKLDGTVRGM